LKIGRLVRAAIQRSDQSRGRNEHNSYLLGTLPKAFERHRRLQQLFELKKYFSENYHSIQIPFEILLISSEKTL